MWAKMKSSWRGKTADKYGFIDQVWGQDGWILAEFFLCVFMDRDGVEVYKLAKKERGQCPAIFTDPTVNKGFVLWLSGKFLSRDMTGSPERAR